MRTHPSFGGAGPGPRDSGRRRRATGLILALSLALGVLAVASTDPLSLTRWTYRATLRARGGSFETNPGAQLQSGFTDCGPAALATLLATLGGNPPTQERIGVLAGTGADGTTFAGLSRAARRLGVPNRLRRLDPDSPVDLSVPFIAWVDRGHFVTVVPDAPDTVRVLDPLAGSYRIAVARLRRFWSGEALVPEPLPTRDAAPTLSLGAGGTS